jgi:hypothetical protein
MPPQMAIEILESGRDMMSENGEEEGLRVESVVK